MKKLFCAALIIAMLTCLCGPAAAVYETEDEIFTQEELLAMDAELDSDSDGIVDCTNITKISVHF